MRTHFLYNARQLSLHLHPIHLTNNQNYMRFIPYTTVTTSVLFQYLLIRVSCNFLLVTFQVVLHHVRLDNYYVFRSCDVVVELGL